MDVDKLAQIPVSSSDIWEVLICLGVSRTEVWGLGRVLGGLGGRCLGRVLGVFGKVLGRCGGRSWGGRGGVLGILGGLG